MTASTPISGASPLTAIRALLVAALSILACVNLHAQALLVTELEAIASRDAPEPFRAKSLPVPDAPKINVVTPSVVSAVASPTRIQVQFQPTAPAQVRPETFKVLYGTFRIDITDRITAASKVTADGIDVAQASLPKGSHKLYLEIQDSAGRKGERPLQFVVE